MPVLNLNLLHDVVGTPDGREDDDEEGRSDQAVEDEHHHIVGLEVLNVLIQALGLKLILKVLLTRSPECNT